ncbi:MAG: WG repeat-containing protein [Oligoflexales bacterium]
MNRISTNSETQLYPLPRNGKWGYIDASGTWIIAPQFDAACHFTQDIALVKHSGKIAFIDRRGLPVSETSYLDSLGFWNGLAPVLVKTYEGGKWGVIDLTMNFIIEPRFEFVGSFFEGVMRACEEGSWGYLDEQGQWALRPKYDWAGDFIDGLARVQTIERGILTRFINRDFSYAFEGVFENAEDFSDGIAPVFEKDKWGLLDANGKMLVNYKFLNVGDHKEGWTPVELRPNEWGFINRANELLCEQTFSAAGSFCEGLAPVCVGELWGFINTSGAMAIGPRFDHVQEFVNALALFRQGQHVGYINKEGQTVAQAT